VVKGLRVWVLAAVALLASAGRAVAHDPPNPNDPCSTAGRDTCGTTGVGFYKTYQYGIRWFGDYKGLPDGSRAFCVDLGYWYPSTSYRYTLQTEPTLTNSLGKEVPLVNRQKIAYAAWAFGRTTNPDRQAAVMLYIHSLMGDARPGEVDPNAIGPEVASIYHTVAAESAHLHGPYRVDGGFSGPLKAGQPATATIRLVSASGAAVPGATLHLSAKGASGVPQTVTANANGVATVGFRPSSGVGVAIAVTAPGVPATVPSVYKPADPKAAPNAQRLIAPTAQTVKGTVAHSVSRGRIAVSTTATPTELVAGHVVRDQVVITGATPSWSAKITVTIHGPFTAASQTACSKSAWQGTFTAHAPGTYTTPKASVNRTGWYVFQLAVPGDAANIGVRTACNDSAERFFVQAQPTLSTIVSSDSVAPGTPVFDQLKIGSLAGTSVTATVQLFGPFPTRAKVACSAAPIWTGAVTVNANGSYKTDTFTPTVPGYYTYLAQIPSTDLVIGSQNACGEDTETTFVKPTPVVTTRVSAAVTRPGSEIVDTVAVSGAGQLELTIKLELFGPFQTRSAIGCSGKPFWTGTVATKGDGNYLSARVTVPRAGYYTFRESIPSTPESPGFTGKCAETSETTLASSKPVVTTQVADDVVRPGSALSDNITVSGLGQSEATIEVRLFGPFATRAAISCTGKPYDQTVVTAQGDGSLRSPPMKVEKVGFYTFHETLVGRDNVAQVETACADTAETALSAPAIITGRGDRTHLLSARVERPNAPTRVVISSLGIDAPVKASAIDVQQGVLAVPADIHKTGWWLDGAAPGDPSGSIVIAGHVDSATAGAGAFFSLKDAQKGTSVQVITAQGHTVTYRVTSVQTMLKADLPTDIWSQKGTNHLVLVTCGGPFDHATGHYRDNVVVTAVPA
jgi:LPXTG-site transpeptidase (sortase) family protein